MKRDDWKRLGLYALSATAVLAGLYFVNLGVFHEWQASFPNAPAEKLRMWGYVSYGLALTLFVFAYWLFGRARRTKARR